jgi:hypothetical protein
MTTIIKKGTDSYSFKIGNETITFPTFNFLSKTATNNELQVNKVSLEEAKLLKTIPGTKPERSYYDLFPDLSTEQMQSVASFFDGNKARKTDALTELSMFPEIKMNHFIKLLELKNVCTKGVFFITTGTSANMMYMREQAHFDKMGEDLISCLDDPSVEFIVMYLNLNLPSTGITSLLKPFILAHRNSIIIDKKHKKIIRFEPMGAMPKAHENLTIIEIHKKISEYLKAGKDSSLEEHMDYIKSFEYLDTNRFDIYSCPFISAPQLGNIFCQTYSIYGALLYIINSEVFNKTPSSLFVALGDVNKIMLMWYLSLMTITDKKSSSSNNKSAKAKAKNQNKGKTKRNSSLGITSLSSNSNSTPNNSNKLVKLVKFIKS